ncbi:hypothetical protein ACWOEQ_10850 [Enterococcus asini]|uniref:hypothetical protein n=1 Tax=Enterococcus asini TaxID=57732 RepID=UPI0009002AF5|nr:hypothetical protein [Enterococcus asini]OJG12967.1 hypothetical protein RU94_GL001666 [Enterococcus asini]
MKKLVSLVLAVGAVFILGSCGSSGEDSKKEALIDLKTTEIPVEEDGTFVIEGTMANAGTIITVAGNAMPIVADSDGNFTHTIQMGDVVDSADLVATYMSDEQTIELKLDTSKYKAAIQKATEDSIAQSAEQAQEEAEKNAQAEAEAKKKADELMAMKPQIEADLNGLIELSEGMVISIEPLNDQMTGWYVYVNQDIKYTDEATKEKTMDSVGPAIQTTIKQHTGDLPSLYFKYADTQEELGESKAFHPETFKLKDK